MTSLTDGSTIAASHQQGYSFTDAANAIRGVDHLQSEERSARDQWEHSSAASVTLSLSRESDIARLYWDKHYRDQHGNLDTARQSEQGRDAINTYFWRDAEPLSRSRQAGGTRGTSPTRRSRTIRRAWKP